MISKSDRSDRSKTQVLKSYHNLNVKGKVLLIAPVLAKLCALNQKIALCGLRWFKLNVSKYQKDVKLSKRCQVVKKMSNVKK